MFGEKILEQRKRKGITQQELADALNISRSTLAGYEAENKKPSYKVLVRMAEYFGVTTDYLLELDGGGNVMLGKRITELRKACDMSQKELGEKLGLSASAIGMYEQGRREPGNAMLIAMENLFGVTVDYLLGGNGFHRECTRVECCKKIRQQAERFKSFRGDNAVTDGGDP